MIVSIELRIMPSHNLPCILRCILRDRTQGSSEGPCRTPGRLCVEDNLIPPPRGPTYSHVRHQFLSHICSVFFVFFVCVLSLLHNMFVLFCIFVFWGSFCMFVLVLYFFFFVFCCMFGSLLGGVILRNLPDRPNAHVQTRQSPQLGQEYRPREII